MALYYAQSLLADSRTVVLGLPYDRTSSFIPGSRFGPAQVRVAGDNVESYSPYQQRDLEGLAIHDAGDLAFPDMSWPAASRRIQEEVRGLLAAGKRVISLGGEHSVTVPAVAAHFPFFPQLVVLQFDAHADLRADFLGEPNSHACAMYQVGQTVGPDNVYQYGIRSGTAAEFKQAANLFPFAVLEPLRRSKARFRDRPLYLSIDIDVLDPGVMPAVATPEPGGIDYRELLGALGELRDCRIVGADIVEYNPLAGRDPASASLMAALLRELILVANPAQDQ
jgi:agmatinase